MVQTGSFTHIHSIWVAREFVRPYHDYLGGRANVDRFAMLLDFVAMCAVALAYSRYWRFQREVTGKSSYPLGASERLDMYPGGPANVQAVVRRPTHRGFSPA
jgi:hypothetical protein